MLTWSRYGRFAVARSRAGLLAFVDPDDLAVLVVSGHRVAAA